MKGCAGHACTRQDPQVPASSAVKNADSACGRSEKHEERKLMGQKETHGILPNEWIAKKLNEWLGPPDPKPTSPPIY